MDLKSLQLTEVQNCSHKVASNSNVATALKPDTGELQSRFLSTVDFTEPLSFLNHFNFLFAYNKRRKEKLWHGPVIRCDFSFAQHYWICWRAINALSEYLTYLLAIYLLR